MMLTGHTNYVQGVAWDPHNEAVVTQSADRSMKIFPVRLSIFCYIYFFFFEDNHWWFVVD